MVSNFNCYKKKKKTEVQYADERKQYNDITDVMKNSVIKKDEHKFKYQHFSTHILN